MDHFAFVIFHASQVTIYCSRDDLRYSSVELSRYPLSFVDDVLTLQATPDIQHTYIFSDLLIFRVEAQALFRTRLRQGRCGCNHGSQYTRHHGQGRIEEANREYEVPSVNGTVASVEEYRGVSASRDNIGRRLHLL